MTPSSDLLMIASSDDSMIEASSLAVCSCAGPLALDVPQRGHVPEDEDASRDGAGRIPDRRGAVVDRARPAVFSDQQRVVREPDDHSLAQRLGGGALDRAAGLLVDDAKYRVERTSQRFAVRPAGHRFRHGIQVGDAALHVGGDDRVTDAVQRDPQHLALLGDAALCPARRLAERDDQETGEQIWDETDRVGEIRDRQVAARIDEQNVARQVSEDRHQCRGDRASEPDGGRDRAEERDQWQRRPHPRIERVAEQDGRGQGGQGQRVRRGRAQRSAAPVDRNKSGRLRQFQGSALP